jgi:signal transduction histidine kinase
MSDAEFLRKTIASELEKAQPDWYLIERLSRGEVDSNDEAVRFSVDAGHIQRLGLELVAKQETALAELVKNAYDADATKVTISFQNHDRVGGQLLIQDDGVGMTLEVVRDSWMRLSTAHKQNAPMSPRFHRLRAGRKGIGRFAVQRLGQTLTLETEVKGNINGLRVSFDWDSDFESGQDLHDIFNRIEHYPKPNDREGTRLLINRLRETWSEAALNRVWKMILSLQSPFSIFRLAAAPSPDYIDPGFEVMVNGKSTRARESELSMDSGFLQHAVAVITGGVDANGTATVRVVSERLGIDESNSIDDKSLLTGPFSFEARYFIYHPDVLSGLSVSIAKSMGAEFGGIRIYRNGFRVAPYGERSDDWLRLDRDTSRRTIIVPANNVNFFGHVVLSRESNPNFEETSSREGLIENEAFEELRNVVRTLLEWAFKRVASYRNRKQTASQKGFVSSARPRKPSEVLENLYVVVENTPSESPQSTISDAGVGNGSGVGTTTTGQHSIPLTPPKSAGVAAALHAIDQAREEAMKWEAEVEMREVAALQYEEMLRILASLGLSISVFGHEIKGIRGSVAAHLAVLSAQASTLSSNPEEPLVKSVNGLKNITGRMFDLGGYIAGLMSNTESRELKSVSLKGAIERFHEQFAQYLDRQRITFTWEVIPEQLRTIEMHASELDSVLLNFLTNSLKSMRAAKVTPRKVKVTAKRDGEFAVLSFEDNGLGIAESERHRIFDAFYTTAVDLDADDALAGPGTGLGLRIVSDIASSYGGGVSVETPTEDYTCNIEFRVRAAKQRGVEDGL